MSAVDHNAISRECAFVARRSNPKRDDSLHSLELALRRFGTHEWFVLYATDRAASPAAATVDVALPPHVVPVVVVASDAEERDRIICGLTEYVEGITHKEDAPAPAIVEIGELRIDGQAHRVSVAGEEVSLSRLEFGLLFALVAKRERVLTRAALLRDVWAVRGALPTRTVDTHVRRVRFKLGSAGRFIQSVRGVGYRFSEIPLVHEGGLAGESSQRAGFVSGEGAVAARR